MATRAKDDSSGLARGATVGGGDDEDVVAIAAVSAVRKRHLRR